MPKTVLLAYNILYVQSRNKIPVQTYQIIKKSHWIYFSVNIIMTVLHIYLFHMSKLQNTVVYTFFLMPNNLF